MRAGKQLGWVMLGVLMMAAGPMVADAKSKAAAADDSDLESRVRALEKKVDTEQQTDTTEHKSLADRVSAVEGDV
ncbi:MAG: hypothetical protein HY270_19460, partial [Deltaproteobacteria bacterium]|nr:hypothetical protein [Deltaproteobacteria bacterium]